MGGAGMWFNLLSAVPNILTGIYATVESAKQREKWTKKTDPKRYMGRGWLTGNQDSARPTTGIAEVLGGYNKGPSYSGLLKG